MTKPDDPSEADHQDGPAGVGEASWAAASELDGADYEAPIPNLQGIDALPTQGDQAQVHATAVAVEGRAALFVGQSGSGKSATAFALTSLGAMLVSDDQTRLVRDGDKLMAQSLEGYEGLIEARGIGVLSVPHVSEAEVVVVVDLDQTELQRLPPDRQHEILRVNVHLVYGRENWSLVPAIMAILKGQLVAT